jgi:hypothetical protein
MSWLQLPLSGISLNCFAQKKQGEALARKLEPPKTTWADG